MKSIEVVYNCLKFSIIIKVSIKKDKKNYVFKILIVYIFILMIFLRAHITKLLLIFLNYYSLEPKGFTSEFLLELVMGNVQI